MWRRMFSLGLALLILAALWSLWLAWQVRGDLVAAERAAGQLWTALEEDDPQAQASALRDLRSASSSAERRTGGASWSVLVRLPFVGDDAEGARALSASLGVVTRDGADPLLRVYRDADRLVAGGGVNLDVVAGMRDDVEEAHTAFGEAAALVEGLDSSGYAGSVRGRFDDYVATVVEAERTLASATTAVDVLPSMLGEDGPRDYLLIFQNNAEIRGTGGLPGSWAQLHAEDGRLRLMRQGSVQNFAVGAPPTLTLSAAERKLYSNVYGRFFHNIGFAPDWPRAASLARAHWDRRYPAADLDGVIGIDPVALSYLLEGTGPISVAGRQLTPDNAVSELLNRPYLELGREEQDVFFAKAARTLFNAVVKEGLQDPVALAQGLARASGEGRLLVAAFADEVAARLADTEVRGGLSGDDGATPHVDIGLNDATQSKMSYYLRYQGEVQATGCADDRQRLMGSMRLSQTIDPEAARQLSDSVTGPPNPTAARGEQLVFVRIYGPYGGSVQDVKVNGRSIARELDVIDDRGRPVVTVFVQLTNTEDVVITWAMDSGEGQTGDGELWMTPGVTPGAKGGTFESAC